MAVRLLVADRQREAWAQQGIDQLRETEPELAAKIDNLSWIRDGLGRTEYRAVGGLTSLAAAGLADDLIEESWVVEGGNLPALQSLWYLRRYPERLKAIMTHANIRDGITEQEAKVLATLHPVEDSDLLTILLDAELITLEERSITLPLAGEIELTIIRTGAPIDYAMNSLEHAVRNIEEFMGAPLPIRQVIVRFDDKLRERGVNYATYVSVGIEELSKSKESAIALLAHEAGHYYWLGFPHVPVWTREGAAHLLAAVANNALQRHLISTNCGHAQGIAQFERLTLGSWQVHDCHYALGERLFRDLHRRIDDTAFRLAFRRLYLHTLSEVPDECGESDDATICIVKEAFTTYAPEEKAADVEKVIARWYDAPAPLDPSWIENIPVEAEIPAIDGRIEEAYLSLSPGGPPVSVVAVGPNRNPEVYLNLDYSYGAVKERKYLPIDVEVYRLDGSDITRVETDLSVLPLPADVTRHSHAIPIPFWGELGRFWVQVYWGEHKIAEATFESVPEPDPHSIRGVVTDTEGQALEGIAIWMKDEEGNYWVESGPDGTFEAEVPPGSFILEVQVLKGRQWYFVGWYDGSGGITTVPGQAFEVVVEGADVEGVNIVLPTDADSLLCPNGLHRSVQTGRCP